MVGTCRSQWHDEPVTFFPCSDHAPAGWITTGVEHWGSLVTLGPPGFPAYARLRFIPDPAFEGQSENEIAGQSDVPSDIDQLRLAVEALLQRSDSPAEGYVLVWDGWGEDAFPEPVLRTPRVVLPNREYYLCRVSLADFASGMIEDSWQAKTNRPMPLPSFMWPSDRAWCITKDVDPHWAAIGAKQALIDQLLTEPSLDVVPVGKNEKPPFYI